MMWGYYGNNAGMMVWGILSSLFWLALLGVAVWALVRWLGNSSRSTFTPPPPPPVMSQQQSPLDILKSRYARGEIDTATYQSMREQLQEPTEMEQRADKAVPSAP